MVRVAPGRRGPVRAAGGLMTVLLLAACEPEVPAEHRIRGADPGRGRAVIAAMGCGACHMVPGIAGAGGLVGPPLAKFGRRAIIAGVVANRPDNLVRWLLDPPSVAPGTAMPDLGLTEPQARDVAAYLYTLR